MRGEAAVARIAGKERTVAEIFHALPAEPADAAGVSEPGNPYAVADPVRPDVAADEVDAADDFVAGNDGIFDAGKLAVDDMKVGPANPAGAHRNANFCVAGDRIGALLHVQSHPRSRQHHRTHLFLRKLPDLPKLKA